MHSHSEILCSLIKQFAPHGIGVEIGVNRGITSKRILTDTDTRHLYMIDPWERNFDKSRGLYTVKGDPDKDYEYVVEFFANNFSNKHTIIRKKSESATEDVPNNLDFIFIDGNHIYKYVMRDLNFWVPKVRANGLVAGHDWWGKFPEVSKAVVDFCETNDVFSSPKHNIEGSIPAPSTNPVVMKSWPKGHLWWAIKKANS